MNDAISRSAAIEALNQHSYETSRDYDKTVELLNELPALDYAPVVHGHWIEETFITYISAEYDEYGDIIPRQCITNKCSVCGRYEHEKEPYCNCGARMDGEENAAD